MIGIVVVSHSHALAVAAVDLASEMVDATNRPAIAVAAGIDETAFGTDATAVAEAINDVDTADGVLLLLDLGSAVLSAEMALEFADPETAARVTVSSAPLVEGLVAAVVLASTGAPLSAVAEEAERGLRGKQEHLGGTDLGFTGDATAEVAAEVAAASIGDEVSVEVQVMNAHGLHARPAAKLVTLVRSFDARVTLTNRESGRGPVDASSLSSVATLNARHGQRIQVEASGRQRNEVLTAVQAFAARAFDDVPAAAPSGDKPGEDVQPTGSGLDVAIGHAVVPAIEVDTSSYQPGSSAEELERSRSAVRSVSRALEAIRGKDGLATADAEIFDAHLALVSDPVVGTAVDAEIARGESAVAAWSGCLDAVAADFEGLDDPYQQARAQDVRSVQRRILATLAGVEADPAGTSLKAQTILVVPELDAATAATVDGGMVVGVVTLRGGSTGHGVLVAKSRGIPIITDVGEAAAHVVPGQLVGFDAARGVISVDPDEGEQATFRRTIAERSATHQVHLAAASEPALTQDGQRILITANVVSVDDARVAASHGADGSGLVRTEVLFGHLETLPSAETQCEKFLAIAAAFNGQPITIRTWDVGGDKPLRFLPQPREANPFLGERGLRLSRRDPVPFREQLAAICAAARQTAVRVMFPMVSTVDEVSWALDQLRDVADDSGGMPSSLEVGIMIEVPAAAVRASQMAEGLDFVSIGTNDLTQYLLAAERGNGAVASLGDTLDPAVLSVIRRVCDEVPRHVEVAVCGDLASRPEAAALLVGLGARELSAVGPAVPAVKAAVRASSLGCAQTLAQAALRCTSAADVRVLLSAEATLNAHP